MNCISKLNDVYKKYTSLKDRISDFMDKALSVTATFIISAALPLVYVAVIFYNVTVGLAITGIGILVWKDHINQYILKKQ